MKASTLVKFKFWKPSVCHLRVWIEVFHQYYVCLQIICPRHKPRKVQAINTGWCFICSEGGNLVCCDTCPTSVHPECQPVNLTDDDKVSGWSCRKSFSKVSSFSISAKTVNPVGFLFTTRWCGWNWANTVGGPHWYCSRMRYPWTYDCWSIIEAILSFDSLVQTITIGWIKQGSVYSGFLLKFASQCARPPKNTKNYTNHQTLRHFVVFSIISYYKQQTTLNSLHLNWPPKYEF